MENTMEKLEAKKIHIPFGKVAAFVAKFISKAKGGFTKAEGEEILADFILLLGEVLEDNIKK
jgi:hypothetical protein